MNDTTVSTAADRLRTQSPERIWGLSVESIYTAVAASSSKENFSRRLSPHLRAEMLRTNDDRDRDSILTILQWIIDEFGLVNRDGTTLLGSYVLTASEPRRLIRAVAVARLQAAETVLRSCGEIEDSLPRREFDSLLADDWQESVVGPVLGSLGFFTIYPDSVELHPERIDEALNAQNEVSESNALAEGYSGILPHLLGFAPGPYLDDVVEQITGTNPSATYSAEGIAAALAETSSTRVDVDKISAAVNQVQEEYEEKFDLYLSLVDPPEKPDLKRIDVEGSITKADVPKTRTDDGRQVLIDIVSTISSNPKLSMFDVSFVIDRVSMTPYTVYQEISSIPEVDCEMRDESVIDFESVPASVDGRDLRDEYMRHLIERCSTLKSWVDTLSDVSITETPEPVIAERVIAEDYQSLADGDVSPSYFVYTLLDPEALGQKKINSYVGESRGLGREEAHLRRWHDNRPAGLRSYTAMTDRLFSLGLEQELDDKILRIMTPFDDDTFNEYVSQIRRLLEGGFELRLLTRHTKEPWEWRRLQRNLLSEIKAHRDRIEVRTYSRFKEHQRVRPDMDFRDLGEFGIHGKLQIIGNAKEGAALVGSANFMENSYDWNPECGVYTERTQFIEASIDFFDIVWDIAGADQLAIEKLQEIPNRQLIPTYYT